MPLPNLSVLCIPSITTLRPCVTLPGGISICAVSSDNRIPDPSELIAGLFGQLNAALAPLGPIFDVLDVLESLTNCAKGVQKALAATPPDPSKLTACFPDLARTMGKILSIIPALSIPALVGDFIDIVLLFLTSLRTTLLTIIRKQLRILRGQLRAHALPSVQLGATLDCASANVDAFMVNLNQNVAPLAKLMSVIDGFLGLAGLPSLPSVALIGKDAQASLAPIDAAIQALQVARKLFP